MLCIIDLLSRKKSISSNHLDGFQCGDERQRKTESRHWNTWRSKSEVGHHSWLRSQIMPWKWPESAGSAVAVARSEWTLLSWRRPPWLSPRSLLLPLLSLSLSLSSLKKKKKWLTSLLKTGRKLNGTTWQSASKVGLRRHSPLQSWSQSLNPSQRMNGPHVWAPGRPAREFHTFTFHILLIPPSRFTKFQKAPPASVRPWHLQEQQARYWGGIRALRRASAWFLSKSTMIATQFKGWGFQ